MTQLINKKKEQHSSELLSEKLTKEYMQLKKENEELRKAQVELNILFGSIDEVLYSVDMTSFKILYISAACKKVTGYTSEEFIADPDLWRKVVYPKDKDISKQQVQLLNRGEQVLNQYRIIHKDKSIHWIENKIIPTLDETGQLIRIDAVTTDITERKRAEKKLEESVSILEATIESTADGILVIDFDGKIVRVNKKFTELWRIPDEILRLRDDEKALAYVSDQLENPQEFLSGVKKLYANQNDVSLDILKFKDGRIFERYSKPQIINGNYVGRVISFRDITVQKSSEKALKESEKRLRQIIDLVPHFIFAKDTNGKFTIVNEAIAKAYGSTVEAIVGKNDADFNSNTKEVEHFIQKDLEVINSGVAKHNIEETITDSEGKTRVISTTKIPYKSLAGPGLLGVSVDISERKKAEKIVQESESRLALATKIAKLGYWEFDAIEGLFTFNDQFYSLFKTTAEKVGGYIMDPQRYAELFVFPDDRNFVNAEVARTIGTLDFGFNNRIEHRMIYANGEVGWISVNFFQIKNDAGVTVKTFGVNQDITDHKKAEEALSNNELRFRTLTSNAPVGIFQTDVNGKTSYVNETWLRYTGLEMNEALGDGWTAAVHPDDRNELIEEWNNKSKKGLKSSSEYRLINKEGNIKWVSGEAIPLFNNTGEITGYIGTLSDITERKKADEALRLAQFTIENTTHAIYWIKSDGSFHMVNNAATQMLGFSFEELMQLNVPGIDPFYNKEVWDGFWQAITSQKFMRLITKHIRKDGTLIDVQIDTHYFRFENLEMSCAFVSDITERQLHHELLKKSEADLEIKNKELEIKNIEMEQFAYIASHDLQEPLRTTSSFVELLQSDYKGKLDENGDKYLTYIAQASDRMRVLIKDLLEYSRIGKKKDIKEVDCNIMLNEVLADIGMATKERNAEITRDSLPVIKGFPTEIKQLFQNLIMNAMKFTEKNVIPKINIAVKEINNHWQFAVTDNGIGIAQEHNDRIFVIFQRLHTRNEYAGSGIGLSHCKKIVELHKGKIWVDSAPGKGSTFYFTIQQNNIL